MSGADAATFPSWTAAIRRYLVAAVGGHLAWEIAQLPLYTLWRDGTTAEIARAVLHCTAGDLIITGVTLILALAAVGTAEWPRRRVIAVTVFVVVFAVVYTGYSEYLNAIVRRNWVYADAMPTLPLMGIGVSPLVQWIVVPIVALVWACRRRRLG